MAIDKRFTLEHPWVLSSEFEDLGPAEALTRIINNSNGRKLLFDLDGTLFDVSPRHRAILRSWAINHGSNFKEGSLIREHVEKPLPYSIKEAFKIWGLDYTGEHEDHYKSLYEYWADHFFSGRFMEHDRVEEGALEFLKRLEKEGLEVFYVSGRFNHCMREGTYHKIIEAGFPLYSDEQLILKIDLSVSDVEFKSNIAKKLGDVRATFDNEPANVVSMEDALPEAIHIFFETVCSSHEAKPVKGQLRMKSFKGSPH
ncbi:MAG: hypothetical protein A3F16_04880 [Deltaproteobacteria bacterium RIFCSPHIGHO2_12_FULL_43_9]|nr:MAG: hypothetical protein A3F16_04880 [Deltaproteobacteria bacterium RIFCSPHIGHO2_12_FULL_43_9]